MGSMADPAPDILTRRFGKEVINYFSGSSLNRVAFLRGDHEFLSAAFSHPTTAILLLDTDLSPLVKSRTTLSYVTAADVESYTGRKPFTKTEDEMVATYSSKEKQPLIIFLGLDQSQTGFKYKDYVGQPYFAVHVAGDGAAAAMLRTALEGTGSTWLRDARAMTLTPSEAATYAIARHLVDWNVRNPFCASCGSATLPIHAGWKRVCPPRDNAPSAASSPDRPACPSRGRISNVSFPRTDPTVITAVISSDGSRVLLGRQKRWPPDWYSTLAGFVEPGESLEEAVRREVWEESGVTAARVVLHSSQPWPFPGGLMVGALAVAAPGSGEDIHLGHDPELENARWFTMAEVEEALRDGVSGLGDPVKPGREGKLRLPPPTAIANRLIEAAVTGMGEAAGWKI